VETLSVVIRYHNGAALGYLMDALRSIAFQSFQSIQAVLVLQNCAEEQINQIEIICSEVFACVKTTWKIVPVVLADGLDGRTILLNHGIGAADGRYLCFLDYDDIFYQNFATALIHRLESTGAALAAGGVVKTFLKKNAEGIECIERKEPWAHNEKTQLELLYDNFLPIHCYVIDRKRIYEEDFIILEDYGFLLKLAVSVRFDLDAMAIPVCEYRFREHSANTTLARYVDPIITEKWRRGDQQIMDLKKSLTVSFSVADLHFQIKKMLNKE
jgi:glycosyltransferase involved in cell wall biosynthesis